MLLIRQLISVAALAAAVAFGGQDASLDLQVAAPQLADATPANLLEVSQQEAAVKAAPAASEFQRVSGNFTDATLADVVKWLTDQGVSFIVSSGVKSTEKLTLNVKDQPIEDVVNAVLDGLNLHAEPRGKIYVIKPGRSFFGGMVMPELKALQAIPSPSRTPNAPQVRTFVFPHGDMKQFDGKMFAHPNMDAEKFAKEFTKNFDGEKFAKEMAKNFDAKKFEMEFKHNFDGEKFAKEMEKNFDGKKFEKELKFKIDGKQLDAEAFAKHMEEMASKMEKSFDGEKFEKELKFKIDGKQLDAEAFAKHMKEMGAKMVKMHGKMQAEKMIKLHSESIGKGGAANEHTSGAELEKLMGSLSASQKALQAKRGYLILKDLTAAQKKMLGTWVQGTFDANFQSSKGTLHLKSR